MNRDWQAACDTGAVDLIRAQLEGGGDVDARDRYGQTGVMRAAPRGHLAAVRLLIERGADLDVAAKYGLTALMLAIVNLHEDVAVALVEAGADLGPRGSGAPGFDGRTALDLARERGLSQVVAAIEKRTGAGS